MSRAALAAAVVVMSLAVGACAPAANPTDGAGVPASVPPPPNAKVKAMEPGLTDLGGGRFVANGWVAHVDLEGGFWAIVDAAPQPAESSYMPQVIAVILPGEVPESQFEKVAGTFVGAEGMKLEGVSVRMSGPEIVVDGIRAY